MKIFVKSLVVFSLIATLIPNTIFGQNSDHLTENEDLESVQIDLEPFESTEVMEEEQLEKEDKIIEVSDKSKNSIEFWILSIGEPIYLTIILFYFNLTI